MAIFLVGAALILGGCAAPEPKDWINPSIKDPNQIPAQKLQAMTSCAQLARLMNPGVGAAPTVAYMPPAPSPQSYNIEGNVTTYGMNGYSNSTVTGTATPTGGGYAAGLQAGSAMGANIASAIQQGRLTQDFAKDFAQCMHMEGWSPVDQ
jgi:hypothetical protein